MMMHKLFSVGRSHSTQEHRLVFIDAIPDKPTASKGDAPEMKKVMEELLKDSSQKDLKNELLRIISETRQFNELTNATSAVRMRISKLAVLEDVPNKHVLKILAEVPSDSNSFIDFAVRHGIFSPSEAFQAGQLSGKISLSPVNNNPTNSKPFNQQGYNRSRPRNPSAISSPDRPKRPYSRYDRATRSMLYFNADGTLAGEKSVDEVRGELEFKREVQRTQDEYERQQRVAQGRFIQGWRSDPVSTEARLRNEQVAATYGISPDQMYRPVSGTTAAFNAHVRRNAEMGGTNYATRSGNNIYSDMHIPIHRIDPATGEMVDVSDQVRGPQFGGQVDTSTDPFRAANGRRINGGAYDRMVNGYTNKMGGQKFRNEQNRLRGKYTERLMADFPNMKAEFESYGERFRDHPQFGTSYKRWEKILTQEPEDMYVLLTEFRTQIEAYRKAAGTGDIIDKNKESVLKDLKHSEHFNIPPSVSADWQTFRMIVTKIDPATGKETNERIVYYPGVVEQVDDSVSLKKMREWGVNFDKTFSDIPNRDGKKKVEGIEVQFAKDGLYKVRLSTERASLREERMVQVGEAKKPEASPEFSDTKNAIGYTEIIANQPLRDINVLIGATEVKIPVGNVPETGVYHDPFNRGLSVERTATGYKVYFFKQAVYSINGYFDRGGGIAFNSSIAVPAKNAGGPINFGKIVAGAPKQAPGPTPPSGPSANPPGVPPSTPPSVPPSTPPSTPPNTHDAEPKDRERLFTMWLETQERLMNKKNSPDELNKDRKEQLSTAGILKSKIDDQKTIVTLGNEDWEFGALRGLFRTTYFLRSVSDDSVSILLPDTISFDKKTLENFAKQARTHDESEKADNNAEEATAKMNKFDLPSGKMAFVELYDGSDSLTKNIHDDHGEFENVLAKRGQVTSSPSQHIDCSKENPKQALLTQVDQLYKSGVRDFYFSVIAHGSETSMGFGSNELLATDFIELFQNSKYKDCTFVVNAISCYGGGLAPAMQKFKDYKGAKEGRVVVTTQTKSLSVNYAAINGEDYSTRYNAALAYYLMQGVDNRPGERLNYGKAHLLADKQARIMGFTNASAFSSRSDAESGYTADTNAPDNYHA